MNIKEACNMALANVRAKSINDISEKSVEAEYCRLYFNHTAEQLQREALWNFCRVQEPLQLTNITFKEWAYAYLYPPECKKINRLLIDSVYSNAKYYDSFFGGNDARYRIINEWEVITYNNERYIATSLENANIDYQIEQLDPSRWDALFSETFVHLLASKIAMPLVGGDKGRSFRSDELTIYQQQLRSAKAVNANERKINRDNESMLTRVTNG